MLIKTLGLRPESLLPKGERDMETGRVAAFSTLGELLKAQKPCWLYGRSQVCACLYAMLSTSAGTTWKMNIFDPQEGRRL